MYNVLIEEIIGCILKTTYRKANLLATVFGKHDRQFSYFSTKTYVVGTQKNRLNETVLLSPQNIC